MPSKSKAQHNLMAACAHGWNPKRKGVKCPPTRVAKEYVMADRLRKRGKRHA